jgi:hypothetical protein
MLMDSAESARSLNFSSPGPLPPIQAPLQVPSHLFSEFPPVRPNNMLSIMLTVVQRRIPT